MDMAARTGAWAKAGGGNLPYDYAIEYMQILCENVLRKQAIFDTLIKPSVGIKIMAELSFLQGTAYQCAIGCIKNSINYRMQPVMISTDRFVSCGFGGKTYNSLAYVDFDKHRITTTIDSYSQTTELDGNVVLNCDENLSSIPSNIVNFHIGARKWDGHTQIDIPFKGNVYSVEFSLNGILLSKLIPCVKDGDICFYDSVRDIFIRRALDVSDGVINAGPRV